MDDSSHPTWPDAVFDTLAALDVRQVAYVPDAGHKRLIDRCLAAPEMAAVPLTTEEEGVALLAGAWLGGQRGVLLMQSSGVGNCVNLFALAKVCRFPLLMLVTMRGQWAEANPWQVPMGQIAGEVLRLAGVAVFEAEDASTLPETVAGAGHMAFESSMSVAVLIGQRLVARKSFGK